MDVGTIVRYLNRHPWASLAAGVGLTALSVIRIRRERREKRDMKIQKKALKTGQRSDGVKTEPRSS